MIKEVTEKLKRGVYKDGAVNIVCLGDSVTQGLLKTMFINREKAL